MKTKSSNYKFRAVHRSGVVHTASNLTFNEAVDKFLFYVHLALEMNVDVRCVNIFLGKKCVNLFQNSLV